MRLDEFTWWPFDTHRDNANVAVAPVPGGWVLRTWETTSDDPAVTYPTFGYGGPVYIPDPGHTWPAARVACGLALDPPLPERVDGWDLSVRTYNALANARVGTRDDLAAMDRRDLASIHNLGRSGLADLLSQVLRRTP